MLNQNNLSPDNILKLLSFGSSVSEILKMIIDNFNKLSESCRQNSNIIKISDLQKIENIDNLDELINNLKELINKESECNYFFVSFDKDFWLYYINYYNEDVKKLKILENIILFYRNMFCTNLDINKLTNLIHENEYKINVCFKSLENDFNQIYEDVKKAEKLKEILKVFFPKEQQKNIELINNYENELKDKLLIEAKKKFR